MKNLSSAEITELFNKNKEALNNLLFTIQNSFSFSFELNKVCVGSSKENMAEALLFALSIFDKSIIDTEGLERSEKNQYLNHLVRAATESVENSEDIQKFANDLLIESKERD